MDIVLTTKPLIIVCLVHLRFASVLLLFSAAFFLLFGVIPFYVARLAGILPCTSRTRRLFHHGGSFLSLVWQRG